ncbi:XRE family transcriptional regulator, partial [Patescibacteria group bacterium]
TRIETNQSEPTLGTLEKIATALNLTISHLITG